MSAALGLTASGLIRALSPSHLRSGLDKHAERLATKLEAGLKRRGVEATATAVSRDGETTIEMIGPNLWQREYGSFDEPARGDVAAVVRDVTGHR